MVAMQATLPNELNCLKSAEIVETWRMLHKVITFLASFYSQMRIVIPGKSSHR